CALCPHTLEVRPRAANDCYQVHDRVDTRERAAQRGRIRDVALDELGAPCNESRAAAAIADKRSHGHIARAQRMHDVRTHEPGSAGDKDGHAPSSKFLKYRLGVGPFCPLYFEPIDDAPYGVVAGSLICMKEICPIFIPG
ncbi:MAG: hypothetical protein QOD48_1875, partial [Gaiellaceae bacterium]|nr:hypothetical protein [Gaiellaceae bacterium]